MKDKNGKEILPGARVCIGGYLKDEKTGQWVERELKGIVQRLTGNAVVCGPIARGIIPVFAPSNCEVIE